MTRAHDTRDGYNETAEAATSSTIEGSIVKMVGTTFQLASGTNQFYGVTGTPVYNPITKTYPVAKVCSILRQNEAQVQVAAATYARGEPIYMSSTAGRGDNTSKTNTRIGTCMEAIVISGTNVTDYENQIRVDLTGYMDGDPNLHTEKLPVGARATGGQAVAIFVAPTGLEIVYIGILDSADVTQNDTNYDTHTFTNMDDDATGSDVLVTATTAITGGIDINDYVLTSFGTISNATMTVGQVLKWTMADGGSGQGLTEGTIVIKWREV